MESAEVAGAFDSPTAAIDRSATRVAERFAEVLDRSYERNKVYAEQLGAVAADALGGHATMLVDELGARMRAQVARLAADLSAAVRAAANSAISDAGVFAELGAEFPMLEAALRGVYAEIKFTPEFECVKADRVLRTRESPKKTESTHIYETFSERTLSEADAVAADVMDKTCNERNNLRLLAGRGRGGKIWVTAFHIIYKTVGVKRNSAQGVAYTPGLIPGSILVATGKASEIEQKHNCCNKVLKFIEVEQLHMLRIEDIGEEGDIECHFPSDGKPQVSSAMRRDMIEVYAAIEQERAAFAGALGAVRAEIARAKAEALAAAERRAEAAERRAEAAERRAEAAERREIEAKRAESERLHDAAEQASNASANLKAASFSTGEARKEMENEGEQAHALAAEQEQLRCALEHVNEIAKALDAYDKAGGSEDVLMVTWSRIRKSLAALKENAS